jgi:hypothetical protein
MPSDKVTLVVMLKNDTASTVTTNLSYMGGNSTGQFRPGTSADVGKVVAMLAKNFQLMANQRAGHCLSVPIKIGGRKKALVMNVYRASSSFRQTHQTSDMKTFPGFWLRFNESRTHSPEMKSLMARIGESSDDPFAKGFGRGQAIPLSAGGQTLTYCSNYCSTYCSTYCRLVL